MSALKEQFLQNYEWNDDAPGEPTLKPKPQAEARLLAAAEHDIYF